MRCSDCINVKYPNYAVIIQKITVYRTLIDIAGKLTTHIKNIKTGSRMYESAG
jgi:hypothetical protein